MQVERLKEQQESMKGALIAAMEGVSQVQARQGEEHKSSAGALADEAKAANRMVADQLSSERVVSPWMASLLCCPRLI